MELGLSFSGGYVLGFFVGLLLSWALAKISQQMED